MRGGIRPGAGRKKGGRNRHTIVASRAKELMYYEILKYWFPIVRTLIKEGLGLYHFEKTNDGVRQVYKARPNARVLVELISFVCGRPAQNIESRFSGNFESPAMKQLASDIKYIIANQKINTA